MEELPRRKGLRARWYGATEMEDEDDREKGRKRENERDRGNREREREWLPGNDERGDQQYRSLSGHLLRGGLRGWRRQNSP